jgi:hypothetical protein
MPFQILPQAQNTFEGNFGTGLGQGLAYLAQSKLDQLTKSHDIKQKGKFWQQIGLPGMEYQPEGVQKSILDRLEGFSLGGQQQTQQPQMLDQLLGKQEGFNPAELEQALAQYQEPQQQQGGLTIGPNPMERRHRETIEAQKEANAIKAKAKLESENRQEQEHTLDKLQPFISKHQEDVKLASRSKKILMAMRDNLIKNKDKFPEAFGALAGNLPEWTRTDPDVRKYEADQNKWVLLSTNALKGQPTNYKTRMLEASKAGVNKPYETRLAQLNEAIKETEDVEQADRDIQELKKKAGKWPRDLELQLAARTTARNDPYGHPEMLAEGTIWDHDDGMSEIVRNGQWEAL